MTQSNSRASRPRAYGWLRRQGTPRWSSALMVLFMREEVDRLIDKAQAIVETIDARRDEQLRKEGWIP